MNMLELDDLITLFPDDTFMKISSAIRSETETLVVRENYSNEAAYARAYHNYICQVVVAKAIQEELGIEAEITWKTPDEQSQIWEFVEGSLFTLGKQRIAIIPSETILIDELHVPQEWVDIPTWAAHIYMSIQIYLDDSTTGWLRVIGCATHEQMKGAAIFDRLDRRYALDVEYLIPGFDWLRLSRVLGVTSEIVLSPPALLSELEAQQYIKILSQPTSYSPRLEIGFEPWASLISNSSWLLSLYQRRINQAHHTSEESIFTSAVQSPSRIPLSQWLTENIQIPAQQLINLAIHPPTYAVARSAHRKSAKEVVYFTVDKEKIAIDLIIFLENKEKSLINGDCFKIQIALSNTIDSHRPLPDKLRLCILPLNWETGHSEEVDNLILSPEISCKTGEEFDIVISLGSEHHTRRYYLDLVEKSSSRQK